MASWEQEQERRRQLIQNIYYQDLGRSGVDDEGLRYWLDQSQVLNNDEKLRDAIRGAARMPAPAAAQPASLLSDQQYSSFFRGAQFEESQIQSALQAAQDSARRRIAGQRTTYDEQRRQSMENTNDSFESRGMYRSGGRLRNLAEGRAAIDRSQQQFEGAQAEDLAGMERSAASQIAELRRRGAEEQISARNRLTQQSMMQAGV